MEEPKKRLRGKQAPMAMETIAGSKPTPKKRLRGKQTVGATSPKMAKAKARPATKGGPRAPQFMEKIKTHWKQNAGAIGLAERVKKRQGKMPAEGAPPVDARDVYSKMPESVRKAPEFSRKFREEVLQVPMTGISAKENYAKLIAEREKILTNTAKENAAMEWQRLEAGAGARGRGALDRERAEYLMGRYHNFDKDALSHDIPKPEGLGRAEADRMGAMIAEAMRAKGMGRGVPVGGRGRGKGG